MANHTGRYTTTYDALQRKRTVVTPVGKVITYSYDALSRKSRMQVLEAGVFTYAYDANNQLVVLQNPQNDRTTLSYDAAGRRTLKELANGTRATMIYDPAGNMTRIANLKSNDDVISQFNYTYDPVGNKKTIVTANGGLTTYSYDATYQLTEEHRTTDSLGWSGLSTNNWNNLSAGGWGGLTVTSAPAYRNTYAYDPTGNRILTIKDGARTTSTFDPANQNVHSLDANGRTTYTFDQSGNRIEVLKPDGSRTTTSYDFENRDVLVQLPSGLRNTMAYDPNGLRVLLQDSSGTTKFIYDNQQYLLQTDGSNVITAVQTQEPGTYSNLVSQYQFDGSLWLPNYYHYDSLGNTSELTDSTENVTDTYDYNAWGELLERTGTTANPFQYRGRYGYFTNPDTGEIYVIMRTYDPVVGRWTTTDLLRFVDGLNMYLAYFVPNGIDPSGMNPFPFYIHPNDKGWVEEQVRRQRERMWRTEYSSCDGYNETIGSKCTTNTCCDSYADDPYPARAKSVCIKFLDIYEFSDTVKCVARCLGGEEKKTKHMSNCGQRACERLRDHNYCYAACEFLPTKGLPEDGLAVGAGMLLPLCTLHVSERFCEIYPWPL